MKFIKVLLASVALIVAASSAHAADKDLGTLAVGKTAYHSGIIETSGFFTDIVTFTLDGDYRAALGAGVLNYSVDVDNFLHISEFKHELLQEGTVIGSGNKFNFSSLTAGTYQIRISGVVDGDFGGQYAGGITIAAVPEPSSVAMLLVGFAALGVAARRRKSL